MIRFLVQVRSADDLRPAERRLRRSDPKEIRRRQDALQKTVIGCRNQIERLLPPGADLQVLENLGGIVVMLRSGDEALPLQEKIQAACGNAIIGFLADAEIELLEATQSPIRP